MSIKIEQTSYTPLPMGNYQATIADITEESGQFGPQLKFVFTVDEPEEYADRTMFGWASTKFSPKSKLYAWTQAALGGGPIPLDFNFDSDLVIGQPVALVLIVQAGEKGEYNRIHEVKPGQRSEPQKSALFGETEKSAVPF